MPRILSTMCALLFMTCSLSAHAFDYKNPENQGVWTNEFGDKLNISAQGVQEYLKLKNSEMCSGYHSLTTGSTTGNKLKESVTEMMDYDHELLAEHKQDPDSFLDVPLTLRNIDTAKKVLNLIDVKKRYTTLEMECGDAPHTLILLKSNQLFEEISMGTAVYNLYQK